MNFERYQSILVLFAVLSLLFLLALFFKNSDSEFKNLKGNFHYIYSDENQELNQELDRTNIALSHALESKDISEIVFLSKGKIVIKDDLIYNEFYIFPAGDESEMNKMQFRRLEGDEINNEHWISNEAYADLSSLEKGNYNIKVYTCTKNSHWDCHDTWQNIYYESD
jgi:hypothetical protein